MWHGSVRESVCDPLPSARKFQPASSISLHFSGVPAYIKAADSKSAREIGEMCKLYAFAGAFGVDTRPT
jgi:hypothetical protein